MIKMNDGFSIIEFIIVIAIMAVLTGILSPAYLSYVEKSKVAVDENVAGELEHITEIVILSGEYEVTADVVVSFSSSGIQVVSGQPVTEALINELSKSYDDFSAVTPVSKRYSSKVYNITIQNKEDNKIDIIGNWNN